MSILKQLTQDAVDKLLRFLADSPWKDCYYIQVTEMRAKLNEPCVLAVAGRVKTGKSSFINAFLGADLALVGTTETTATINYFRHGTPDDPNKPIRCEWSNGRITWESQVFLDALQGNTVDVLERAAGIRHLEFYVNNPRLEHVLLVDTPGTGALVGDDGQQHENVSRDFFNMQKALRDRHSAETLHISSNADAVIYLIGEVGQSRDADFLLQFQNDGVSSHVLNTIGIMAKVDLSDELIEKREYYAKHAAESLSQILPTPIQIVPVSAGLHRALSKFGETELRDMQTKLRQSFSAESLQRALGNDSIYRLPNLPGCPLSVQERLALRGKLPWRVFVVLAKTLHSMDLAEAISHVRDIAGFEQITELLEKHFFQRSSILRCHSVINNSCSLLYGLMREDLYKYGQSVQRAVTDGADYIDFIMSHPNYRQNEVANRLRRFIKDKLPADRSEDLRAQIEELIMIFEQLLHQELASCNRDFEGLHLMEKHFSCLKDDERRELSHLFGAVPSADEDSMSVDYCSNRQRYWRLMQCETRSDARQELAELASTQYATRIHRLTHSKSS